MYDNEHGDNYNRGVENFRENSRMPSRGRSSSPSRRSRSRSRTRTRSRSPIKRNDNRNRSRGGGREIRDKECRVYVSNLSYDMKWMELKDVMKKIGPVEHVEVFTDGSGRSKGCAVVEFSNSKDAERAIKEYDNSEMQGRKVKVREDIVDESTYREQLKTQKDKTKNLKENMQNQNSRSNLGFGGGGGGGALGGALGGLNALNNIIGGNYSNQLQLLSMLNNKGGDPVNSTVFASNLDYEITWQKLKDLMRGAGNCQRCDILQDDSNRSKGYGTVVFDTPMEALSAVAMFNGYEGGKSRRPISVRLDRNSPIHQVLNQLGVSSTDINKGTLSQLQQIATLVVLAATNSIGGNNQGGGGLGNMLGGLGGALGNLSALTGGSSNAYGNALQNQQGLQGNNLSQLGNLAGLGLAQQLQGLGGLLQNRGSGNNNSNNMLGGNSYGVDSSNQNAGLGLQNLSSFGGSGGSNRNSGGYQSNAGGSSVSGGAGTRVFVRNLPFSFTWQMLKDKFRDAGRVARADIKMDDKMRSKGYGTVTFETNSDAQRAIALFNGSRAEGREIEVKLDRF